ncbi:hypothetical protein [Mesorhizobium sp. M1322]|uniref:hypothetical protein n=1 Tax=Mesorhizobium sp. M1322 TaxID=2957081 RepID=UPI00333BFE63
MRSDTDGPALGELIFNNMNMMFIEFVKRDEARIAELRAAIRRQNRILVAAIGRRPLTQTIADPSAVSRGCNAPCRQTLARQVDGGRR